MPLTATFQVIPSPLSVTTAVVAPAVPLSVRPALVKPVTGLLKTTVKSIGEPEVGFAWAAATAIVTVGGVMS